MNLINRKTLLTFSGVLLYGIIFYLIHFTLFHLGLTELKPATHTLLNWDATYYYSITEDGYLYSEETYSNSGFFILFPLIWKLLQLNVWTVSILNAVFFATSFTIFTGLFNINFKHKLLWLTFPSLYITFVPYSEALFLLLSTLLVAAMIKKKNYLVFTCLFLLSLTRPITIVLLPALIIAEILNSDKKLFFNKSGSALLKYGLPLLIGTSLFVGYQYYETGVWFAYFKQQQMHWGHNFSMPTLPFGNAFGSRVLWLDAIALFIGFYALIRLVQVFINWLKNKREEHNKLLHLSYLFFTGMGLVTILFNPTWGINATNIYDIHRYTFVSPFFLILLHHYSINKKLCWQQYLKLFLLLNFFWLFFRSYHHIQEFLYFNMASIYVMAYFTLQIKHLNKITYPLLILFNIIFQVLLFQWYISWLYPG